MKIIRTIQEMQRIADHDRSADRRIGLVPTMGSLHDGHLSLVDRSLTVADETVVSIFVNPTQFNSREDFERYPRDGETDRRRLLEAGVDVLFLPEAEDMYPEGHQTAVEVTELSKPLCGAHRPGHFTGVATVVTKLLLAVKPHVAVFGRKDYQQLLVVRRLVRDLNIDVEILEGDSIREEDGLAMSSRNARLDRATRRAARAIPDGMELVRRAVACGETDSLRLVSELTEVVERAGGRIEYAELRDPETLELRPRVDGRALLAVAAWFGGVRLIDNEIIETSPGTRTERVAV